MRARAEVRPPVPRPGRHLLPVLALSAALLLPRPDGVGAQELERALAAADGGVVRFSFAARPGVRICADGIRMEGDGWVARHRTGEASSGPDCPAGPVRLEVSGNGGRVVEVEMLRRGDRGRGGARELGLVPADEAVRFLTGVARGSGSTAAAAEAAVFPLVLADVERVWETLLALARDGSVPERARSSALFWLGQEAAEAVTDGLAQVASDAGEAQEIRDAAVFALSLRSPAEGRPVLMELATTARHAQTRRSALFWLARDPSPEVVDFFAEILRGGAGEGGGPG